MSSSPKRPRPDAPESTQPKEHPPRRRPSTPPHPGGHRERDEPSRRDDAVERAPVQDQDGPSVPFRSARTSALFAAVVIAVVLGSFAATLFLIAGGLP